MAAGVPIIRSIAWPAFILHAILIATISWSLAFWGAAHPLLYACCIYVYLIFFLRLVFSREHRRGIALVHRKKFDEAIPYFEKSYEQFGRKQWLDRWRMLFLLSLSRVTYREMALTNIAFCYSQTGDGAKAREYYIRTLQEYPDNAQATAALKMADAFTKEKDS